MVLNSSIKPDNVLNGLLGEAQGSNEEEKVQVAKNSLIRVCSEAIMYAVAKCYSPANPYHGFKESFYPRDEDVEGTKNTKLLITVLNGGKAINSTVKFAKFYLVVDAHGQGNPENRIDPIKITNYYQKFLIALKKGFQATKGGEASFKVGVDGAYFNANATIAESFKMIEDAIIFSGANDDGRKIFQIGINCDGDSCYNKDPKDPNKYEQEGQKVQFDQAAMMDYYAKIL